MMTRKEAFKMAMDIDGHMNDNSQGIDLSWGSIEKLVNEAYAKGAAAEREECAKAAEAVVPRHTECGNKIAGAIRARSNHDKLD